MFEAFSGEKVLYIATKKMDYLRIVQETENIGKYAKRIDVIGSYSNIYFMRLLYVYFKIIFRKMKIYDSVFIGFAPQLIVPFFKWKFKRKKLGIDFFISVYDTMVFDRKKFGENSVFAKICYWLDSNTIKSAERIVADTKAHAKYFSETFDVELRKIDVLYLEADKTIYYPQVIEKPIELADKYIVFYFGSILPLQGVNVIINAAIEIKEKEKIHFIIVGPIKEKEKKQAKNITYISWLEQMELARYIAFSDLCLAGHFSGGIEKAKRTIAGKTYIYEVMNKVMVLGENEANRELFLEDERHCFVEMNNVEELVNKIEKHFIGGNYD